MTERCPTCGSAVRGVAGGEGTFYYEPANVAVDALLSDEEAAATRGIPMSPDKTITPRESTAKGNVIDRLECAGCGGTALAGNPGRKHCGRCGGNELTKRRYVAVDVLLSDEAVKAWNRATRAHRHAAHASWASTSPDDYQAGIRGVLEAASTGQEKAT